MMAMPVIRPAQVDDALAMARVHVGTYNLRGHVPDEHLANLSYERCQASWIEHLSNPQGDTHACAAEAQLGQSVAVQPQNNHDPFQDAHARRRLL
jgi:hypothetical protein